MRLSNYHTHCNFCDGAGPPLHYVQKAIQLGFTDMGFSSHAPVPFDAYWAMKIQKMNRYIQTLRKLKTKYAGQLHIYCGLEIDYIHQTVSPSDALFKPLKLDYKIGSIHYSNLRFKNGELFMVGGKTDTFKKGLSLLFQNNIQDLVTHYYQLIQDMVTYSEFDIVGHLDMIKKHNIPVPFFDENDEWYHLLVEQTLNIIKDSGRILEVNTGGLARNIALSIYPSGWILQKAAQKHIPIVLNSDAHQPEMLSAKYDVAIQEIKRAGYQSTYHYTSNGWRKFRL